MSLVFLPSRSKCCYYIRLGSAPHPTRGRARGFTKFACSLVAFRCSCFRGLCLWHLFCDNLGAAGLARTQLQPSACRCDEPHIVVRGFHFHREDAVLSKA